MYFWWWWEIPTTSYFSSECIKTFRLLPQLLHSLLGQYLPPTPSVSALPAGSIAFAYSLSYCIACWVNTFRLLPQFVHRLLYQYLSPTPSANALPTVCQYLPPTPSANALPATECVCQSMNVSELNQSIDNKRRKENGGSEPAEGRASGREDWHKARTMIQGEKIDSKTRRMHSR